MLFANIEHLPYAGEDNYLNAWDFIPNIVLSLEEIVLDNSEI
jgi:hypothetical protein